MTEQALPKASNFGDLALNLDQNHEMNAQLISFEPTKFNDKGNRYQDCVLSDGQNQQKVKVWEGRNGIPLAESNKNQWLTFSLSARRGSGKWANNVYYGGFWQMESPVVSQAPQVASQAPVQPTQQTNPVASSIVQGMQMPSTYAYPVTPETQKRMGRSVAVEAASRVVAAMINAKWQFQDASAVDSRLLELSDIMFMWIQSGNVSAEEPQSSEVCSSCQLLLVDCTCDNRPFVR